MTDADRNKLRRIRERNGQRVTSAVYDGRTLFALHLAGLLPETEREKLLSIDRKEYDRRVHEAATLALDLWTSAQVDGWMGTRKKPLRVTPPSL